MTRCWTLHQEAAAVVKWVSAALALVLGAGWALRDQPVVAAACVLT